MRTLTLEAGILDNIPWFLRFVALKQIEDMTFLISNEPFLKTTLREHPKMRLYLELSLIGCRLSAQETRGV